jgi:hypothetical protein
MVFFIGIVKGYSFLLVFIVCGKTRQIFGVVLLGKIPINWQVTGSTITREAGGSSKKPRPSRNACGGDA